MSVTSHVSPHRSTMIYQDRGSSWMLNIIVKPYIGISGQGSIMKKKERTKFLDLVMENGGVPQFYKNPSYIRER